MSDLRARFLKELVDFIRSKLNAHVARGGGIHEFINGYLRIPCDEDVATRERAVQALEVRRERLEDMISCSLFAVRITGLVLDAGMKPVWTLIIYPKFNTVNESVVQYFEVDVHGHGYKLLEMREIAPFPPDATGWSMVLNELRIESTLDALKKTEPPAG